MDLTTTRDASTSVESSMMDDHRAAKTLSYTIHKYSSYSAVYAPENILLNKPSDHQSRWSSETSHSPQFLILKLEKPAIVSHITFGKYSRCHYCNIKKFKIYGSLEETTTIQLLEGGLKNDSTPETFPLKHSMADKLIPCRYIKIIPIQSWAASFNYSIWYVELRGQDDYELVQESINWYNTFRQKEALKLVLKHLRQNNYIDLFNQLQEQTKVQLEDELLSRLNRSLVMKADFEEAESIIDEAAERGLFNEYIKNQEYKTRWTQVAISSKSTQPSSRGGHQICFDHIRQVLYLFGGVNTYSGDQCGDLWAFDVAKKEWNLLYDNGPTVGPTPRFGHRMCMDTKRNKIYLIGRYVPKSLRYSENLEADFYVFDVASREWRLVSHDTASEGGPYLIANHSMCMDIEQNRVYVFGGTIMTASAQMTPDERSLCPDRQQFSGLYYYDVKTKIWRCLREDSGNASSLLKNRSEINTYIKSRVGQIMLYHDKLRRLYISGGQRGKDPIRDLLVYHVDTDVLETIFDGEKNAVPFSSLTLRATIDTDHDYVYVFSGQNKGTEPHSFWLYDINEPKWASIYRYDCAFSQEGKSEPCPKSPHQVCYDMSNKVHYFYGSDLDVPNDSISTSSPNSCILPLESISDQQSNNKFMTVSDFWELRLVKITEDRLRLLCKRQIRQLKYKEMISVDVRQAIRYLQQELCKSYDLSKELERNEFHSLSLSLFSIDDVENSSNDSPTSELIVCDAKYLERSRVFDKLVSYFPESMAQPKTNLVDLIFLK